MGIFSKLKSIFGGGITFDESKSKGIVTPQKLKGSKVKIDSKVKVPQNYSFVLASCGKCLDVFSLPGEFFLSAATLPECCKKLKIHKMGKDNKIKKSFKADAYFVNLNSFVIDLKTFSKAELGGKASGIFHVGMLAKVKLKVLDVKKYMQVLLDEYAYLRPNEAEKITLAYLSDFVLDILYKYNFALSEFLSCNKIVDNNVTTELGHKVAKMGLVLEELSEIKYILPKKYQKEYEANYNKLYKTQKEDAKIEQTKQPEQQENIEQEKQIGQVVNTSNDYYTPFGSIVIESNVQNKEEKQPQENKQETAQEPQEVENQVQENELPKEQEFVDLNLDNLYKKDKKGKKCKFCGLVNSSDATICEICNNSLD